MAVYFCMLIDAYILFGNKVVMKHEYTINNEIP
jgi:hypothetical protein